LLYDDRREIFSTEALLQGFRLLHIAKSGS
jgi:hypothetical protein